MRNYMCCLHLPTLQKLLVVSSFVLAGSPMAQSQNAIEDDSSALDATQLDDPNITLANEFHAAMVSEEGSPEFLFGESDYGGYPQNVTCQFDAAGRVVALPCRQTPFALPVGALDLSLLDLPTEINKEVGRWIEYYLTRGFKTYTHRLALSNRYVPRLQEILHEEGVPRDLVYVVMIESGFEPSARSPQAAAGLWQLTPATGKFCQLRMDAYVDDRYNPERSTRAAARLLRRLYDLYGDWNLALAAYNVGPRKVDRAITALATRDYWTIARTAYLPPETRDYVPKLLALALLSSNPSRFGIDDVAYAEAPDTKLITVNATTDLDWLAARWDMGLEDLEALNPELRRGRTPPEYYDLLVPDYVAWPISDDLDMSDLPTHGAFHLHTVAKGQCLSTIADRYDSSVREIMDANQLTSTFLSVGRTLRVPVKFSDRSTDAPPASSVILLPDEPPTAGLMSAAEPDAAQSLHIPLESPSVWALDHAPAHPRQDVSVIHSQYD